ncbi:MAG TPA: TIGR02300 family protein [Stellaceae bacterium]|nr:TIGR02300 family protein [Stellaceae bacterium]
MPQPSGLAGGAFGFDRMRRLWQWRAGFHPSSTHKEQHLAKPEWGTKRICPSCGTRYYDLLREQVICPKCSTPYDPEAFLKARRARPVAPVEKELAPVGEDADVDAEEVETADEEEEAVPLEEGEEEEDEELIEDASELGEDDDDMAEVIDNVEEEEP